MLMADDSSSFWASPEFGGNDDDNLCMDYDQFISLIEQPNQSASDDSSLVEVLPNGLALDDIKHNDSQGESYASQVPDINNCDSFSKPGQESIGAPSGTCLYMDMLRGDMSYGNAAADSSLFQSHDYSFGGNVSSSLFGDTSWVDMPYGHGIFPLVNQELITDAKDEELRFPSNDPYLTTNGCSSKCEDSQMLPNGDYAAAVNDVAPEQPIWWTHPGYVGKKAAAFIKDEKYDSVFGNESFHSSGVTDGAFYAMSYVTEEKDFFTKDNVYDKVEKEAMANASKRARYSENMADGFTSTSSVHDGHLDLHISEQPFSYSQISTFGKKHLSGITSENSSTSILANATASHSLSFSPESSQSNSIDCRSRVDDDPDICIIEEMSHPAPSHQSIASGSSLVFHNEDPSNVSLYNSGVGATRLKINAEQLIYQVALQDLSQPKSEEIPPDGVLAVPLLRHQRIALSWMVKKETAINCCGGILADDQGLGKTVSTIALILKERPPSFRINQENENCGELQTLDLDGDENVEGASDCKNVKLTREKLEVSSSGSKDRSACPLVRGGGRPAAGTLVVCPTSVLRQWEEELHNKVTSTARLSVLVYHGGNRTKDPHDLAKYDVVLTTYSIVSMEVPKQPLVDKDDDEGRKPGDRDLPPGILSGKRRKDAFSTSKKRVKDGKKMESELLESIAGPLAKVGWFRVILDEAQSIKNYRTQVARACWGLRAKRRWCLSGTPIQNAIDDLYSYFRFLRYDPFAVYKTFCSTIKGPIQRSPAKGYRKLQAILKTIMLRRTKGTLLDGEPIINLPPKSVELKKVEFSKEERDFYSRLEADSRAQFAEYAAAGTVKENYVNILLMLLRLRQACDHPLLVKGYDSSSRWQSSVEMAKKLPREKQIFLLNRLEASLAICGICNDPPEEAVVSICGHVFCNQCLCELLAGDDGHCPTTNCKVRLSMSMVFSKDSLNISLSDQPVLDGPHGCSHSDLVETVDSCSLGHMYDSSKISAALEVLQSLSKMQDCKERDSHAEDLSNLDLNYSDSSFSSPSRIVVKDNAAIEKRWTDSNKPPGEKAIVFSQWTRMLDLLEARLKDSSIQYRRLDGTMSVHARDKAVKDFNAIPEVSVMIMSLKAASLGLNMVSACHVLLLDLWWNPTTEDQAVDRAHRIGQTRPVRVLRLTVKDTVEDRILALQQKKRQMVASAFGEDEKGSRQTRLTVEDLKYLFMA